MNIPIKTQQDILLMQQQSPGFIETMIDLIRLLSHKLTNSSIQSEDRLKDWTLILSILELSNTPNLRLPDILHHFLNQGHLFIETEQVIFHSLY